MANESLLSVSSAFSEEDKTTLNCRDKNGHCGAKKLSNNVS